jgi:acetylornithine deacetylase
MPAPVIELARQLVRIPSVNPMGRDLPGTEAYESRLTDFLESFFARHGLPSERQTVAPLRDNILARLDGTSDPMRGGALLLIDVHQDTVPVDGMTVDPYGGDVSDGRLYGRGACDVKGSMACILTAMSLLAREGAAATPTVVVACTVNEECGFAGAEAVTRTWQSGTSTLLPRAPDAVIVAEPTGLDVVVAHKGVVRWRCHARGRAAHSSAPDHGQNAIYLMGRVLGHLETYAAEVVADQARHPLVGPATLAVGTIRGGVSNNTVPDRCTIDIDRRTVPGEDPGRVMRHVVDYLRGKCGLPEDAMSHEAPYLVAAGLNDADNGPLAERVIDALRPAGIDAQRIGVPYGTNAGAYAQAGVPTVVCGPGAIAQAHTADEWIAVDQLERGVDAFRRIMRLPCECFVDQTNSGG